MSGFQRFYRTIALTVAVALLITSLPLGMARAGLVTTDQVVGVTTMTPERERLVTLLQRDDVRQQMEALGVDREEALARLATLSDPEVQQIAGQLDELPAGGLLTAMLVAAGAVFIALVLTDLFGITNVFPFVGRAV